MREYFLMLVGLLYCAAGSTLTFVSVLLITRKVNDNQLINANRLPDILLNVFPAYEFLFEFTEGSIVALFAINIILIVVHQKRWLIIKRILVIFGTAFWLRFLMLMATFFPIPNDRSKCPTEKYVLRGFRGIMHDLKYVLLTFGLMNSGMVSCGDSMFSGHAASVVILASNFTYYIPKHYKPLRFIIWAWAFFAILTILCSHMHYTMDVVVGVWVSRHIFTMYYQIVFVYEIYNAGNRNDNNTQTTTIDTSNSTQAIPTGDTTVVVTRGDSQTMIDHTVFCIDNGPQEQPITPNYLIQNFGIFFWLNPIFVYFEKNTTYQENVLVLPEFVSYVSEKIRNKFVLLRLYFQNKKACKNRQERTHFL